jgi:hypothetical protein
MVVRVSSTSFWQMERTKQPPVAQCFTVKLRTKSSVSYKLPRHRAKCSDFLIAETLIRFIRVQFMINSAVRRLATIYERGLLRQVRNTTVTMAGQ